MRTDITTLAERERVALYRAAFSVARNAQDAEDAVQETFLKYLSVNRQFETEQHIHAWLLRVVINKAKNINRSFWKRNRRPIEDLTETAVFDSPESSDLFRAVMDLPEKYRIVIHLFYYEDYPVADIARILRLTQSNVKTRLSRGRALLRETLREGWDNDE